MTSGIHREVSTSDDLAAAERTLRESATHYDLVILPREFSEGGLALYDDSLIDVVKRLKGEGIDIGFAHPVENRSWIGEKSAELLLAVIVGIVGNAAWAGLIKLARLRNDRRLVVRAAVITRRDGETMWQWHEFDGSGEDVAKAIEALRADQHEDGGEEFRDGDSTE